jgi:hypothetical protein
MHLKEKIVMKLAHRSQSTLALILGCAALALAAPGCGDDDDSTGANGGSAGKSNTGGKAGGTSTGGKSSSGGGTGQGGKTTGTGGKTGTGGDINITGGAGAGGQPEGGAGAGPVGTGGTTSGGTSSGGTSSGGTGTGTGGSITVTGGAGGFGGEAGLGGEGGVGGEGGIGGSGGEGGATQPVAPIIADTFDSAANGWYPIKYYDTCTNCYNDNTVTFNVAAGVGTLTVPFGAEANTASHIATLGRTLGGPWSNVAGKTFKVKMRWVSGGVGTATNATGGFDVYLIANDGDWTESSARYEFTIWDGDRGAPAFKELTFKVPAASGEFDPATVNRFTIRIDSKFFTNQNDPQPVFDYTPAVFEIDSIVVQ